MVSYCILWKVKINSHITMATDEATIALQVTESDVVICMSCDTKAYVQ